MGFINGVTELPRTLVIIWLLMMPYLILPLNKKRTIFNGIYLRNIIIAFTMSRNISVNISMYDISFDEARH